jgi:hypothetical protein
MAPGAERGAARISGCPIRRSTDHPSPRATSTRAAPDSPKRHVRGTSAGCTRSARARRSATPAPDRSPACAARCPAGPPGTPRAATPASSCSPSRWRPGSPGRSTTARSSSPRDRRRGARPPAAPCRARRSGAARPAAARSCPAPPCGGAGAVPQVVGGGLAHAARHRHAGAPPQQVVAEAEGETAQLCRLYAVPSMLITSPLCNSISSRRRPSANGPDERTPLIEALGPQGS